MYASDEIFKLHLLQTRGNKKDEYNNYVNVRPEAFNFMAHSVIRVINDCLCILRINKKKEVVIVAKNKAIEH